MKLTIGWLYPDLMNTYGDRGNIIVLEKRCFWRGIEAIVKPITVEHDEKEIENCDLLFMGGAQDKQQEIVNRDLQSNKGKVLIAAIEKGIPSLFVCGAYQFMGKYYKTADGTMIKGLGIFDLYTVSPGLDHKRLIGNIIVKPNLKFKFQNLKMVGFENHGGRTHLADKTQAFATVVKGYGNNGDDGTEGISYKYAIGTYLHGSILPKNPELADWLIEKALEKKYKSKIELKTLDDSLAIQARDFIIKRY
jgi:lipid II isoglutaminyl synthase (glutamine-hydrolysing)